MVSHWRNYEQTSLNFSANFNQIVGPNAQGKTNLLEAIHFLISGRSFRTHHMVDLIRDNQTRFYLEAHFLKQGVEQKIKVSCSPHERKILYNATALNTLSELIGIIPGVLMTPQDDELVRGSPQARRDFLDLHIAQLDPLYVHHLTRYNRALKQRNQLLKHESVHTIETWEYEMAKAAAYLVLKRKQTIHELEIKAHDLLLQLSNQKDLLRLFYQTTISSEFDYKKLFETYILEFEKQRKRELIMGYTLIGPQKDDVIFSLSKKEARLFASEGQARTLVSALRLAQWHLLKDTLDEKPLMIIDDIGMSLDPHRKGLLFNHLEKLGQVFVSTPEPHPFKNIPSTYYTVNNGTILS